MANSATTALLAIPIMLPGHNRMRLAALLCFVTVAVCAVGYWAFYAPKHRPSSLHGAQAALDKGDFKEAGRQARALLDENPDSAPALMIAAKAASSMEDWKQALAYLERVPSAAASQAVDARCLGGEILLQRLHRLSDAEHWFKSALEIDPGNAFAHERLAYILALQTRADDLPPHVVARFRAGDVTPKHVNMLALGDRLLPDAAVLERFHEATPDDPAALVGVSRVLDSRRHPARSEALLRKAVNLQPHFETAQTRLGRKLLDHDDDGEFLKWHARLPEGVQDGADVWEMRGKWFMRNERPRAAVRCFWEAVKRKPELQAANHELGRVLVSLGREDEAQPFLTRSRRLQEYVQLLADRALPSASAVQSGKKLARIAELAESLGLLWETWGWAVLASRRNETPHWNAREMIDRIAPRLDSLSPTRTVSEANPALAVDLSEFPIENLPTSAGETHTPSITAGAFGDVRFRNDAPEAGMKFDFYNDADPMVDGQSRMFDFTGGGVAVLDYDRDGAPDVYFPQGAAWPEASTGETHLDQLYRNHGGRRFNNETVKAAIVEPAYSQGVAVGDFDADGFPDLYVACLRQNRLFHNNGDGTFSDATSSVVGDAERWTTSCLMADLNGDALPDLYAVNYLSGEDVLTRVCRDRTGFRNSCLPQDFDGAQDQIFLNTGDGQFLDVTAESGIVLPKGKGLGILAADFEGSGRLDLFVANDGTANFFLKAVNRDPDELPLFQNAAYASGLAFNGEGRTEACMGVAADDFDGDGRLDLFVTNFSEESNTLYAGRERQLFDDATRNAGLNESSYMMLGFGTQSIDADLDGRPDLIVSNGHVDNYSERGIAYRMPPQYFANTGGMRFVEADAQSLGEYFKHRYLGRGMARLDWNLDGLEDVIVTHLKTPAALLTNATVSHGRLLAVQLQGVESSRDAVGTTVTVRSGDFERSRQLTAGDGYLSSNQRILVFGLGEADGVDEVNVRWPSDLKQSFKQIPLDAQILLIEGDSRPFLMRQFR